MCENSVKTHRVIEKSMNGGINLLHEMGLNKSSNNALHSPDDGIIVIDDDDCLDEMQFNATKPEFIKNVDVLMKAIGGTNYNDILDALCSISNIGVRAKALNALFSCDKEIQSRKVQTEMNCCDESHNEVPSTTRVPTCDTSINNFNNESDTINYQPEVEDVISHVFFDDYASEVVVESQYQAEAIVTGEGELTLNNQIDMSSIKFILKGDGKMNHNTEEE